MQQQQPLIPRKSTSDVLTTTSSSRRPWAAKYLGGGFFGGGGGGHDVVNRKTLPTTSCITPDGRQLQQRLKNSSIILISPLDGRYQIWWCTTAVAAIVTAFLTPFQIAFQPSVPHSFNDVGSLFELFLTFIFTMDILIQFHLQPETALTTPPPTQKLSLQPQPPPLPNSNNVEEKATYTSTIQQQQQHQRHEIFLSYISSPRFYCDLIGIVPWEQIILQSMAYYSTAVRSNNINNDPRQALGLSLVRMVRFLRLYRLKRLSDLIQYNGRIKLLWSTLLRNVAVILFTTHLAACSMYFCARWKHFGPDTWIGSHGDVSNLSPLDCYVRSLWLSVVAFMTVGFGDYSAVNTAEMIIMLHFMMINIVVSSWFIGSVTLLVVKGDEKTGEYRDSLETLHVYSQMHEFDTDFEEGLKRQLRLEFNNREIADEQVLKNFPSAVRRKILRKLYLPPLVKTQLFQGIRPQFVDAFLTSCTVEIFSPGECIVERGSILSDLFLLVGGVAEATTSSSTSSSSFSSNNVVYSYRENIINNGPQFEVGDFIGEIGFFTESPQIDSVVCVTVCKTLTMSQSSFKLLAQDHPGSVGKILQNLLAIVQEAKVDLPSSLPALYAGSMHDYEQGYGSLPKTPITELGSFDDNSAVDETYTKETRNARLTAIRELVAMHMSKLLDDQTTRFCFAASRGDTGAISLMCDQGFDPNNADYDKRTALMVAAMKGNTDVVKMLLKYNADPNLTDVHGTSALLEAVKNGHEVTVHVLASHGASLCLPDSLAASILCQAVFDSDIVLLQRLLKAGIPVNACDYDKRTAAHIAAAEGNMAALRILGTNGANFELADRWNNTVHDEAERAKATPLLDYLQDKRQSKKPMPMLGRAWK